MSRARRALPGPPSLVTLAAAVLTAALCMAGRTAGAQPSVPATAAPAGPAQQSLSREQHMDVRLNGRALGPWLLLEHEGYLYLAVPDLQAWRLYQRSDVPLLQARNQAWYPLAAVRGAELRMSADPARLEFTVPATALMADREGPAAPAPSPAPPAAAPPLPAAAAPAGVPAQRFLPLEVSVNGSRQGAWVMLEQQGALHAPEEAFSQWRLPPPRAEAALAARGQRWFSLASVAGFTARFDAANQSVALDFAPGAFAPTQLQAAAPQRPALTPSIPAAFVNYDLSHTSQSVRGLGNTRELGALMELGLSNDLGVLTSSHAGTGLLHSDPAVARRWRRLETTFTRDFPQRDLTLRVGDSSTRAGIGGRSVFFGGLQIGRNFGLTPGFLAQPIPTIAGTSSAPSTVELYVNDALRQTSRVPAGPFAIDNFPLLTGSGQARLVVRDLLGRETVLVQDFFSHTALLAAGLSDWSAEIGAVRQNLGTTNSDYGQRFASGLYRIGLSNTSTLEARAEFGEQTRGAGLALSQVLPGQLLGQLALAASRDTGAGSGLHVTAGLEHQSLRHGFALRAESASDSYRRVGQDPLLAPTKLQLSASYNYAHPDWGSLGLALARLDSGTLSAVTTASLNYAIRLGERSSLAMTWTRVSGATQATALAVSLTVPLDAALTSYSSVTLRDGKADAYTAVNKALSQETGASWRTLLGQRQDGAFSEAGLYYQGGKGLVSADLSASQLQQTLRLGARGGVALADGRLLAARRIENSFAIVEVPGHAGIGVGFQGSSLTRTDASGIAILPQLQPYARNSIRLDPRELPISAEIDNIEQVAVPAARSAVKVVFPVRSGRGALVKLVLDDGEPAPAGAEVDLVGDRHEFFVARRGEAFITGLQEDNQVRLRHNGQSCTVRVVLPPAGPDEIARIGPLACTGVKR